MNEWKSEGIDQKNKGAIAKSVKDIKDYYTSRDLKFDRETRQEVIDILKGAFGKNEGRVSVTTETTKEEA